MNHLDQKTDEEIITLVLSDKHYYAEIVLRYEEKLTRYVRRIAQLTLEELEDLLQDIFVKAYININGFNPTLSFSSWIYRITHNETMTLMRKRKYVRLRLLSKTQRSSQRHLPLLMMSEGSRH